MNTDVNPQNTLVSAMDNFTGRQVGENGNIEYSWSNNFKELFTQFYFQLVRTVETCKLEQILEKMLTEYKSNNPENYKDFNDIFKYEKELCLLYKLIGHTRDIVEGKGEYTLAFMQVWVWYKYFPDLALKAVETFVYTVNGEHPYGSWKDMKYLAEYVKERSGTNDHPLIKKCVTLMCKQLDTDHKDFLSGKQISLAGKWCPREKGRFAWFFKKIVKEEYKEYYETAEKSGNKKSIIGAHKKACMTMKKRLSTLNKYLDTTQIKMCGKEWTNIDFNKVTSLTMHKNKNAFLNSAQKEDDDRKACAENLKNHLRDIKSGDNTKKIHGKRVNVYELVRSAYNSHNNDIVNLQWEDNKTQNRGLKNIIPMADTSGSMTVNNSIPLFNAIGLSIRVSELAVEPFKNRILTFSHDPEWVKLNDTHTFTEKVKIVSDVNCGMNTNLYAAFKMILDSAIEANLTPETVSSLTLAIFSDMHIDIASVGNVNTVMEQITEMYSEAGKKSTWKTPFDPPHILFWNLTSTSGFPVLSSTKNVTMLSGYSATLLNILCDKGVDELKTYTPLKMISELLSNKRYNQMKSIIMDKLYV